MNYPNEKDNFTTKEAGLERLKELVQIRDKMGGALYYNICQEDCMETAMKLKSMGVPHLEVLIILNNS